MNIFEFKKSITNKEYRAAMQAKRFALKKQQAQPLKHWRIRKLDYLKRVNDVLDGLNVDSSIRITKKSYYPSIFKKKQKILKTTIGECQSCKSKLYLQVHHIDKNKFNNEDSNLILLCYACHKSIHNHLYLPSFLKV